MTAAQFYALTYFELTLILKGYTDRRTRELRERREESAWLLTWLLLPYQKKGTTPLTVDALMGRKARKSAPQFASMEERAQAWFAAYAEQSKQGVASDGQ